MLYHYYYLNEYKSTNLIYLFKNVFSGMLPPPPQEFSGPPNGPHPPAGPLPMPDFSKPPPGFPQAPPPIPLPTEMDLTPSVPYYELPAGLMAPLVKVSFHYFSIFYLICIICNVLFVNCFLLLIALVCQACICLSNKFA